MTNQEGGDQPIYDEVAFFLIRDFWDDSSFSDGNHFKIGIFTKATVLSWPTGWWEQRNGEPCGERSPAIRWIVDGDDNSLLFNGP